MSIGLVKARDGSVERRVGDQDQIQFDEDEFSVDPQAIGKDHSLRNMIKLGLSHKNERPTTKTHGKKTRRNGACVQNPDGTISAAAGVL